jgi:hypothetical protein
MLGFAGMVATEWITGVNTLRGLGAAGDQLPRAVKSPSD